MVLHFAAPLFNDAERAFNRDLASRIEQLGYQVFLPQRDGAEADRPPYDVMTREQRRTAMFQLDRDQILACDALLFITDGQVPDEGGAVELGMAYTHRHLTSRPRLLVGLRTDVRTSFTHAALNPMISQALDVVCASTSELLDVLAENLALASRAGSDWPAAPQA